MSVTLECPNRDDGGEHRVKWNGGNAWCSTCGASAVRVIDWTPLDDDDRQVSQPRHPVTGRFLAFDCEVDCLEHCAGLCGAVAAEMSPLTEDDAIIETDATVVVANETCPFCGQKGRHVCHN